jgi:hypothetical protein
VSFHSYIPNWYIGENNFYYSGINGCCDDINLSALIGNLIPPPPTTTTTTTIPPSTTTTTTTVISLDCTLVGVGNILDCDLAGTGVITVPSPTTTTTSTACTRPARLNVYGFYDGYQYGATPPVVSSGSSSDACAAITFVINNATVLTGFSVMATSLEIESTVYYGDGTDCTPCPDGWYFTLESISGQFAYHVVDGVIVEIFNCLTPTTTSTTTSTPVYLCYSVQVNNECTVSWIDYTDTPQSQTVISDTIYICAKQDSITASCELGSSILFTQGGVCTSDLDCQPTTTTTTTIP